jgi:hypothetical protein
VQIENNPHATIYFDGSTGPGTSWAGAPHNSVSNRVKVEYTQNNIITDCVLFTPSWNKIATLATRGGDYVLDYSISFYGKRVSDALDYATTLGTIVNGEVRAVYLAMWEQRALYKVVEPGDYYAYPDWILRLDNTYGKTTTALDITNVFNRVYSTYADSNGEPTKTVPSSDALSITRYGLREGFLSLDSADSRSVAAAIDAQNMALKRYRYPRPVVSVEIRGLAERGVGLIDSVYMIRAGQTIILADTNVTAVNAGQLAGDAASRAGAFVLRTDYDASSDTLRVDLGASDQSFEILMARLGISGGLS